MFSTSHGNSACNIEIERFSVHTSLDKYDVIDAFPYNGPGTSNGARPAGRDRVLHAFACRMSASRRKKGRKTLKFLV